MARKTKLHAARKTAAGPLRASVAEQPVGENNPPAIAPAFPPALPRLALPALLALLGAGLLLRISSLSDLSLWMDEYVHVMRAKEFLENGSPLFTDDNNGILLTLCLLPLFALFGANVFWARFPGVVFGVALIYLVYRLGTRLFNRYVGLFAAGGVTLSLFLIFWSRVCRNYSAISLFYPLLGLVFLAAFEAKADPQATGRWVRLGISRRYLWWLPTVGVLAFLSHQLTFFFVFTVAVYSLLCLAGMYWSGGDETTGRTKYAWMVALTAPFLLVVFVPPLGEALKQGLSPFLLSNIAEWAIPDWTRLAGLTAARPMEAFDVYHSLLAYDLNLLYLPALLGFGIACWHWPRAGAWLLCSFAVPFVLMSFVFREPTLRRYLIFVYPYVFIACGVFFYALWRWLSSRVWPAMPGVLSALVLATPFALLLANTRWSPVADLALARRLEGHIVDTRIANWSFTNWKEPCAYVNQRRQPGDVFMSTVPSAVSFYMNQKEVLWFRQAYYDTHSKQYRLHAAGPAGQSGASTLEALQRTVQQSPRGWLLADYYLENVFTDERALLWVYQNMHFYSEASTDGSVMVFGWDHSKPKPERQNLVVELGHDDDKTESKAYHMTLPEQLFGHDQIELTVRTRRVDSNREALVLFNDQNAVWLPPNTGDGIEETVLPLQREWIKPGQNTIRVLYEPKRPSDPRKGFTLYFLSITGK
ncbi:MAG: glycosyltransferase family 39 protein [Saprospirales bacterium]|jgi:4-amino-4-deoxy-L-arabinose transferase-like glycosyltransferase|nr:glycosyltransferase family 39 protein [Saprospirales bacterium]